jgi:Ca-activated chloride channel family protein
MRDVPHARTSVILALDVSGSMCSSDVEPNRLAVAQDATREFVEKQPNGVQMGLVVFSGFAELVVPPTHDRKSLLKAIDGLTVGRGTAIGGALLKGVDAIAEVNANVRPVGDVAETQAPPQATTPGGGGYGWFRRFADEPTLKAIAARTGGTFHAAKDADQLQKVFSDLPSEVATQRERTEVTWLVAALGALCAAAAVAASLRWSPYP